MKFLKIINCFELPRKDIEKGILAKTFLKSGFPLTKIFISDSYNGMHPKNPADKMPWLEGEIRKCKEKRNEKTGVRQMIFGILGSLACGVSVMGCYPLVPAYFTALYLEQVNGVVLLAFMYIGMTLFMPLTAAVKYGVTLIVMIGAVKLIEWANEGCPAFWQV